MTASMNNDGLDIGQAFLERSRYFLQSQYLPKIKRCVAELSDDQIWQRSNDPSNSIGNLLLHLQGNLNQWVVCGVGGAEDRRDRQSEFDARGGQSSHELIARLEATVNAAADALAALPPARLTERTRIQGRDVTLLGAIYHAVEHFGQHTGQIILMTKAFTGRSLEFYRLEDGIPRENW